MAGLFRRKPKGENSPPPSGWTVGDSIPAPEVVQKETDSAWALWHSVSAEHEARFADTEPAPQPLRGRPEEVSWANTLPAGEAEGAGPEPAAAPRAPPKPLLSLEAALRVARRNARICPRPQRWEAFVTTLPPRKTTRGLQQPPPAVTGPAWTRTPEHAKRLCFREHLEWSERVGLLQQAMDFMQSLPEEEWLHAGEQ